MQTPFPVLSLSHIWAIYILDIKMVLNHWCTSKLTNKEKLLSLNKLTSTMFNCNYLLCKKEASPTKYRVKSLRSFYYLCIIFVVNKILPPTVIAHLECYLLSLRKIKHRKNFLLNAFNGELPKMKKSIPDMSLT